MLFFRLKNVLVLKIFSVAQSEGTSLLPKARNHEDYMRNNHEVISTPLLSQKH